MPRAYKEGQLCAIEDCEKLRAKLEWCHMHYRRWKTHGDPLIVATTRGNRTHGMSHTGEWRSWEHMKRRCLDPGNDAYHWYGGRGITVHEPWIDSFEAFFEYMGPKPGPKYSIDRIDVNGNYEPGNVRWATPSVQASNKRKADACKYGHPFDEENTYITPAGYRQCRICKKARKQQWDAKRVPVRVSRKKPYCKHGHEYTPENTYITKKGSRACRECLRETGRRTKERNRERVRAQGREYMRHRRAERRKAKREAEAAGGVA